MIDKKYYKGSIDYKTNKYYNSSKLKDLLKAKRLVGKNKRIKDVFTDEEYIRNIYVLPNGLHYALIEKKWRILGTGSKLYYTVAVYK